MKTHNPPLTRDTPGASPGLEMSMEPPMTDPRQQPLAPLPPPNPMDILEASVHLEDLMRQAIPPSESRDNLIGAVRACAVTAMLEADRRLNPE